MTDNNTFLFVILFSFLIFFLTLNEVKHYIKQLENHEED